MGPRFRLPLSVVAAALVGLITLLGTLQYRWLGRISDAERERMTANLAERSRGFAQEFDREITRAFVTFQLPSAVQDENVAARVSTHYDRWLATARFPRLIKDVYFAEPAEVAARALQRFSPATRFIEPVAWPESLAPVREQLVRLSSPARTGTALVVRTFPSSVVESVPALVVPAPMIFFNEVVTHDQTRGRLPARHGAVRPDFRLSPSMSYVVLVLDGDYMTQEMLPTLMQQHFRASGRESDYQIAVLSVASKGIVYRSGAFAPDSATKADASAGLFQVRLQEFGTLAAEVRRFTTHMSNRPPTAAEEQRAPVSIVVQKETSTGIDRQAIGAPRWMLMVKHSSGSLEAAVTSARRRNLFVSSSVLVLLGVSVGFLVVTTRRAQELARQQMEFVAAVSHELRTPLAVIRSAADNLADGVVHDDPQVRKYGDLVRGEGRRLTEMVEQILELSGIHSGQRSFALRAVPVISLMHEVMRASSTLSEAAQIDVEFDIPESLPPVLGDEQALRRVFQNLIGNAIKYGASGGWIGVKATSSGREVTISVSDKGIGIPATEQQKIFEPFYRAPDVVAARIHGAGLGLNLVRRIVEAHGGRVGVRSVEGSGSEFSVHLPAATGGHVARTASARDAAASPS